MHFFKNLRLWLSNKPILASLLLMIFFNFFRKGFYFFFKMLPDNMPLNLLHEFIDIFWPLTLVFCFGYLNIYSKKNFFKTLFLSSIFLIYSLIFAVASFATLSQNPNIQWQSLGIILFNLFSLFAVGFREESIFRGICANVLARKYAKNFNGILVSNLISSLAFGFMHLGNIISGASFIGALYQSINAFALGMVFCAIYFRGGNIWVLAIVHSLFDVTLTIPSMFTKTYQMDLIETVIVQNNASHFSLYSFALWMTIIFLFLFLIRRSKCDLIIKRYQDNKWS